MSILVWSQCSISSPHPCLFQSFMDSSLHMKFSFAPCMNFLWLIWQSQALGLQCRFLLAQISPILSPRHLINLIGITSTLKEEADGINEHVKSVVFEITQLIDADNVMYHGNNNKLAHSPLKQTLWWLLHQLLHTIHLLFLSFMHLFLVFHINLLASGSRHRCYSSFSNMIWQLGQMSPL